MSVPPYFQYVDYEEMKKNKTKQKKKKQKKKTDESSLHIQSICLADQYQKHSGLRSEEHVSRDCFAPIGARTGIQGKHLLPLCTSERSSEFAEKKKAKWQQFYLRDEP